MAKDNLIRSAASRMLLLGGLAGRVGVSMAGNVVGNLFRAQGSKDAHQAAVLLQNAIRVKNLLGQLKGVPMKIGQMVSLHEKLLPKEVAMVLKTLQQQAPAVSFDDILEMIQADLGDRFGYIKHIDEKALAAASIGQVHRAVLNNGCRIALKVQYPGIDDVIKADLKNLKGILKIVFSMFSKMDMEPVWQELNDRLLEELDYIKEAENMKRMSQLFKDDDWIIVPKVIDEVTSRHVLGMELVEGISADNLSEGGYPQELKDAWGVSIFRMILKGLFKFRFLHADPNIANFAFLDHGGIIVYDFGCMKEVPEDLCRGYVRLLGTLLNHDYAGIPEILKSMGVHKANGESLSGAMVADFVGIFQEFFNPGINYCFGADEEIYKALSELGYQYFNESRSIVFPKDIIFIDRTFGGHFGNLCQLNACADWQALITEYIESAF